MSRLPKFAYFKPGSIEEVCSLLGEYKEEAKLLAGGTDLLIRMQQRLTTPRYIISLKGIPGLDYVNFEEQNGLRIGALATLAQLANSPLVKEKYPLLSQAAKQVGVPPLRQMGTIGGNICLDTRCIYYNQSYLWRKARSPCIKNGGDICYAVPGANRCFAVYQADLAPALIALEAKVKIIQRKGERVVTLGEFFTGRGESPFDLGPDELLAEIQIPPPKGKITGAYQKLRVREAMDFPLAGIAVAISLDGGGICREAKVVLGAIASAPIRATQAEEVLQGRELKAEAVEEAAEEVFRNAHPVNNLSIEASYRRKMVRVLLKRAIEQTLNLTERT